MGASFIRCCYAAHLIPLGDSWCATALNLTTAHRDAAWGAVKMSLKLSRFFASPACIAGVRVTFPNLSALCGRTKL